MKIVSSYSVRLLDVGKLLAPTIQIYRAAVAFLIDVADKEWDTVGPIFKEGNLKGQQQLERLVHGTKSHPNPKYDFDAGFYKFPGYFRRAALSAAMGAVSSYRSNLMNWEQAGKQGKPPKLTYDRNVMPTFFKDGMSDSTEMLSGAKNEVRLKLYINNDWVYRSIQCRRQDVQYLAKWWNSVKVSAPTLEVQRRKGGKLVYRLRYAFEETRNLALRDESLKKRTVLAVDLGINNDAVCSVMCADGTILVRKFINFPSEKDRLHHILNRIKRLQREYGRTGGRHEWAKANRINDQLSRNIANAIMGVSVQYAVNVIVFEHLDMRGKSKGSKKQRLHLWRKRAIQKMVMHKAHRNLMRCSSICAWGTSKLAFDGSGEIIRGRVGLTTDELAVLKELRFRRQPIPKDGRLETYCKKDLCTFPNGKEYNCDLSASYNIGARYFLREFCKEFPELEETLPKATLRTYADLRNLKLRKAA